MTDPQCPVCNHGSVLQFRSLQDKLFGTPVEASYYRCLNDLCLHLFCWPMPDASRIPDLYTEYSTHQHVALRTVGFRARLFEAIVALFGAPDGLSRQIGRWRLMDMEGRRGAVLDVGCGSGNLLDALRSRGFDDLFGVDFDAKAIQVAREIGLDVAVGEVAEVARHDFDFVLMNHVIEHLPLPGKTLEEVRLHLKPGGYFIIRTPNSAGFLARRFGADWRGLEPPRHLNIFTVKSLERLAGKTGFEVIEIGSTNAMLQGVYLESAELHASNLGGWRRRLTRLALRVAFPLVVSTASLLRRHDPSRGEEVFAVLRRKD